MRLVLELTEYLLKTYLIIIGNLIRQLNIITVIKNELEYSDANQYHINRSNNIGNKGHKYGGNNGNNNINMDNKIGKNFNKNRQRNIIWFNPSFRKLSNINIGKYFLSLISKHFKDDNSLRKIINKNNIKISYFCTNNISKITDNHNKKLINKLDWNNNDNLKHSCNCNIKNEAL